MGIRGELFTTQADSPKRTYFFNVKETRRGDLFINIVESAKRGDEEFTRQSLMVFQEDLGEFLRGLNRSVGFLQDYRDKPKAQEKRHTPNEAAGEGTPDLKGKPPMERKRAVRRKTAPKKPSARKLYVQKKPEADG